MARPPSRLQCGPVQQLAPSGGTQRPTKGRRTAMGCKGTRTRGSTRAARGVQGAEQLKAKAIDFADYQ